MKPSAVTIWALSLRTCSYLWGDRLAMKDKQNNKTIITHNEAGGGGPDRITSDTSDRLKIKEAPQNHMDTTSILATRQAVIVTGIRKL